MYCSHCGNEIDSRSVVCIYCGETIHANVEALKKAAEPLGFLTAVFSFLCPPLGFILYFAWKECALKKSNTAGLLAFLGFLIMTILYLVLF